MAVLGTFTHQGREPMSQAQIYLIPGYLSENTALAYGPHRIAPDDESLGIWGSFARDFARQVDAPVSMVNWKAGTGFLELCEGKISPLDFAARMAFQFGVAIEQADQAAKSLARDIEATNRPAVVIGHSMGGRVALKVREHCSVPVIAFAPSAAAREIDWERFGRSTEPAECFHSRNDYMIGLYGAVELVGKPR
jgi:pimeloyl-ACP methyl ester carboxylesterase